VGILIKKLVDKHILFLKLIQIFFICALLPIPVLLYKYNETGNSYNLIFFILFIIVLILYFLKNRMDKKVYDILLVQCDPKSYKEFQQLLSGKKKNNILYVQEEAVACYYLGEFSQSIKLFKFILPKYKTDKQKLFAYYWQSLCYIFTQERELFKYCLGEMENILQSGKLKKSEQLDGQFLVNKLSLFNDIILDKQDKQNAVENLTATNELALLEKSYLLGVNEWNQQHFEIADNYFTKIINAQNDIFYVKDAKSKISE
jgi:hypothetical protein